MAKLKLNCEITDDSTKAFYEFWGENAISFNSVDEFINSMEETDNKIDVEIHSCGGNCLEGWAIYDRLRTSGKEISVDITGICASMATVIALAAPIERRRMGKHASLMIHKPYYEAGCFGYTAMDAETLQRYADSLNKETEKILDVYVERTGTDREVLREQMSKKDELFGFERAKELGFVSDIIPEISAKLNINKTSMNKSKVKEAVNSFLSALGFAEDETPVNMTLSSVTGEEFTIERESGEPEVGDSATPDGTFELEDGRIIVVSGGKISSIEKKENDEPEGDGNEKKDNGDSETIDSLKAQIAELETKLESAHNELTAANNKISEVTANAITDEQKEIVNLVTKAGGMEWLKDATSSHEVPAGRANHVGKSVDEIHAKLKENHKNILKGL